MKITKPVTLVILLELIQISLELTTLAGDCGVAPGGIALGLTGIVWIVRGPSSSMLVGALSSLIVLALKASENNPDPENPATPKRVIERHLEGYSPLSGYALVHGDHVEGERSSVITLSLIHISEPRD